MPDIAVQSVQQSGAENIQPQKAKTKKSGFDAVFFAMLANPGLGMLSNPQGVPQSINTGADNALIKEYGARLQAVAGELAAASKATGVDQRILAAFMIQESGAEHFENGQVKRERYGGIGIMQIAPENSAGYNLADRAQNIMRGAEILRGYLDKYAGNIGLAAYAYNSGQGALASAFKAATGRSVSSLSPQELHNFNPLSLQQAIYQDALNRGYSTNVAVVKRNYAVKLIDKINHLGGMPDNTLSIEVSPKFIPKQGIALANSDKTEPETSRLMPVLNLPVLPGGQEVQPAALDLKQDFTPILKNVYNEMSYTDNDKVKSFEVKLSPEHLGSMVLKVSLENGQLNTHIIVSNSHVADLLNSQLGDLRHVLAGEGLNLGQLDVGLRQNPQQGSSEHWGTPADGYQGSEEEDAQSANYSIMGESGQALDVLA